MVVSDLSLLSFGEGVIQTKEFWILTNLNIAPTLRARVKRKLGIVAQPFLSRLVWAFGHTANSRTRTFNRSQFGLGSVAL